MEGNREVQVYVQGNHAGVLKETEDGYSFLYLKDYVEKDDAVAVSLTLPLRKEEYQSRTLFSFFDGIIPEGWLLDVVSRNWKVSPEDRFGILMEACGECIGDVQILKEKVK